ncbi:hypothetical protein Tco_1533390, partial [Tanacetum coccineum]
LQRSIQFGTHRYSPFSLVSMYHRKRDLYCEYLPGPSIGGRSFEPAAMILLKGLKGQKEAKTVKNQQETEKTRQRVKTERQSNAGSARHSSYQRRVREANRLSKMDDDLFTYEVEVANIPCDSKMDDDSEHEADDDMGYDPSDVAFTEWRSISILLIRGDDEVELTDEESSDDMDEVAETYLLWTLRDSRPMKITRMIRSMNGTRTYHGSMRSHELTLDWKNDGYCNGGNLPRTYIIENQLHYQDYEWYEALEESELKDEALRNKAIMEGFIKEDYDESCYEQKRRWNIYTNNDDAYEINHKDYKSEELCEVHELPLCNIRRYMMIKYSFNNDEEYVAVKEDEYDDLTIIRKEACRAY